MFRYIQQLAAAAVAFAVLFVALPASAQADDGGELGERLAELRAEVDKLSDEVEEKKDDLDAQMRSTRDQKADLEARIKREETRQRQLRESLDEAEERVDEQTAGKEELIPAVEAAIEQTRKPVESGLPFKRSERLGALDDLEEQLDEGVLSPQKATSRLWQFVEDELRLARESGMHRQRVEVGDEEVLADVVRIGMVALYYRTSDGRVGAARHRDGEWRWESFDDETKREQIDALFESFEKNVRVGFFTIPNALSGGGR
ncbi:MAG: DUF3450 family protein [Persicimonas sp.]